jgi:molybdopterin/thiamine biosynthesis adenylyltransferase
MNWALRDPGRFLHEHDEFEKLSREAHWLKGVMWRLDSAFTVEVEVNLDIHGTIYAAKLTYPDLFPETPAYIRPREASQVWSGHQYVSSGVLCLEWRSDNWDSRVTGADLVRSAYKLLSTEHNPVEPGEVPSVDELTLGQELRGSDHRFLCTSELMSVLGSEEAKSGRRLHTSTIFHRKATVSFVSQFDDGGSMRDIQDLPKGITKYGPLFTWHRNGYLFKSETFDQSITPDSVDELIKAIRAAGFSDQIPGLQEAGGGLVLLIGTQPESLQVFSLSFDESGTFRRYDVLLPEKVSQRLPAGHAQLRDIRVGIVGLGSLGSKVAVSLARSGIRRFLLIDDDVLMPGNLSRHELSWQAVGTHKAEAIREELTLIAPGMDVDVRLHRIAGQESAISAATALKDLTLCDLLIDATANPDVFVRLAAVARTHRRPMCWGEIFAGGFGGLIARARPDGDPHPTAVRAAIVRHLETLPPAPYQRADNYSVGGPEPAIAYDSDVAQVAAALTRLALDVALKANPSAFPYSAYLIGLRKEWIFSQPFDTYPIDVVGEGWAGDTAAPSPSKDRTEALRILLHIFSEEQHVSADSSS